MSKRKRGKERKSGRALVDIRELGQDEALEILADWLEEASENPDSFGFTGFGNSDNFEVKNESEKLGWDNW